MYSAFRSQTEMVVLLFETLNNTLQYQGEGNARLTYGLVRQRDMISSLSRAHDAVLQLVPDDAAEAGAGVEVDIVALGGWTDQVSRKAAVVLRLANDLTPVIEAYCAECAAADNLADEDQVGGPFALQSPSR